MHVPTSRRRTHVVLALVALIVITGQFLLLAERARTAPVDQSEPPNLLKDMIAYQASLRNESWGGNFQASLGNATDGGVRSLDDLDAVLANAADVSRTVILIPFNEAYIEIASNLICSIQRIERRESVHLPVVYWPLDNVAYLWAQQKKLGAILYDSALFSVDDHVGYADAEEQDGKHPSFFKMMRERGKMFRRIVHDLGYNMLFLDADVVLLANPLNLLRWDSSVEIQIDAWDESHVLMEEVEPAPGPEEVKQPQLSVEANHARAMRGPANPKSIPYFRPESSYAHASAVTGSSGVFFLRADDGGRFVARELDRLLRERGDDLDDQQALNVILSKHAWPRNLAPLSQASYVGNGTERVLTMRYLPQYATVSGPVFFKYREGYLRVKGEKGLPEPTLVHANGVENKKAALQKHKLWYIHTYLGCINVLGMYF
ncbi:hypothetical protein HK101_008371 [Irineochytrium annulatum]|nr:hypothetical protein HK101_008371 [Irineochytrium annulatum]